MTSKQVTSPPWNSRRLVHSKEMVWASRWSVALRAFYRQILSLTYSFFFETSAPGLSGHYLYTNITSLFLQTFHQTTTSSTGHSLPGVLLSGHRFSSTRAPCCNSNSHTSLWPLAAANINGVLPSTSGLFLGARDDRYNRKVGKWKAKWCVFCVKPQKSRHRFFQKMSFDKKEIWYACEVWHRPWKNNFPIGKVTFQGLC